VKDIDESISIIVKACTDKKGTDIKVLDLRNLTTVTDYFVIVSGNSTTQVIAIADEIEEKMNLANYELLGKEGYKEGTWVLLDYGNVVVHVFRKAERDFYNLERVWADSRELILEDIK